MGPPIFIGGNRERQLRINVRALASMGPPIFIGGNAGGLGVDGLPAERFNGATDFHRWKSIGTTTWCTRGRALQWGHRFSSVEIARPQLRPVHYHQLQWGHRFSSVEMLLYRRLEDGSSRASMGPPIFIGGNTQPD